MENVLKFLRLSFPIVCNKLNISLKITILPKLRKYKVAILKSNQIVGNFKFYCFKIFFA